MAKKSISKINKDFLKSIRKNPQLGPDDLYREYRQYGYQDLVYPGLYNQVIGGNVSDEKDILRSGEYVEFIKDSPELEAQRKKRLGEEYYQPVFTVTPQQRQTQEELLSLIMPQLRQIVPQIGQQTPEQESINRILKNLEQMGQPGILSGAYGPKIAQGLQQAGGNVLGGIGSLLGGLKGAAQQVPQVASQAFTGLKGLLQGLGSQQQVPQVPQNEKLALLQQLVPEQNNMIDLLLKRYGNR